MTRTGRILAIETKGEMLKGDDSRDKLSLGNICLLYTSPSPRDTR